MSTTDFSEQRMVSMLKQELAKALEQPYALATAIAKLENASYPDQVEGYIMEAARTLSAQLRGAGPSNVVVDFPSRLGDAGPRDSGAAAAQELILATLREREASVRELQITLEDHGIDVSPGNLSVILSRMTQARAIQRTGRGLYKYQG
ncbi:MAG: hypothetical protein FJX40_04635 [Alphaproteobacteria bacterium]|nr:hypothetical protein [Alphaproteobacteria bacterium]MBM3625070.1 hypothetical protein [Alphaproteobacteria bacterium]MBM3640993.1 hypothetical protein [Alphaproteobacteria bacterium]